MTRTITTTMQPNEPITVDEVEYLDLKAQGLIHTDHTERAPATAPAITKAAKSAATSKEG